MIPVANPGVHMPHDIFISYSRKNLDAVKSIKEELEAHGFSCWMDLNEIPSDSTNFVREITPAIREARVAFLFFLSHESQASEYATKEIRFASRQARKRVVIVRFMTMPFSMTMPIPMS